MGRVSVVGTATLYGLDVPGIEFQEMREFPQPSRPALGPTQPAIQWPPGIVSGLKRTGRGADHTHHLALRLKKNRAATPPLGLLYCSCQTRKHEVLLLLDLGNTGQKTENVCKYFTEKPQRKIPCGLASSGLAWNRVADSCRHRN